MPEPTNDAQVENVLSAIRRLIAEGQPEGQGGPHPDPLVLTPALRVSEPSAPSGSPMLAEAAPETPASGAADPLILMNALPAAAVSPVPPPPLPEADSEVRRGEGGEAAAPADSGPGDPLPPAPEPSASPEAEPPPGMEPAAPSRPDEAALRALVTEAVREELRGELGERLTRNLRKLVRHEVMQALAMRDLG